ncbi:hypothetical protein L249_6405 [Ophiocordyceps polyrhachis-furcata BCC 54312]|uniref:Uncharacterized protein n=1 Tax=Ophiocordyceps polyrhachis-furcata BCC 54312 TaxID=1330021 RepID=A0A367LL12_9HYPO|nr:hypothetical protein L249_6405 [Ophiocordyceps polyrhachis-furcata BCC 54312]
MDRQRPAPPVRRRYSMEEDIFYNQLMGGSKRDPSQPPPYRPHPPPYRPDFDSRPRSMISATVSDSDAADNNNASFASSSSSSSASPSASASASTSSSASSSASRTDESPPRYQSTVNIEGVFSKKHEIEDTIKRAEDRQWHTVFVLLQGTALNVYSVKKDWGWGRTRDGPAVCPDNPPWVRRSKLEKSYSLLHADAGIAADYTKRRYVIRVRAETDQFLLSCIELSTFVKWLESLFAAIGVAAPIDDRDFPRDMSIPRVQRIRWFRGQSPALPGFAAQEMDGLSSAPSLPPPTPPTTPPPPSPPSPPPSRPSPAASPLQPLPPDHQDDDQQHGRHHIGPPETTIRDTDLMRPSSPPPQQQQSQSTVPSRIEPPRRLSTTNYPNASIDPYTGKWFPEHKWSSAHDLLYAKLCYSNLLFRSPRKSNYIISKGKQWVVDWGTGRMVRVLPPAYGEIDYFGPWQVIHTENFRI